MTVRRLLCARSGLMSTTPTRSHVGHRGQNPRVMLPEGADADDRHPQPAHARSPHDRDPRLVGRRDDGVAVEHQRLAGVDRERPAPATRIA